MGDGRRTEEEAEGQGRRAFGAGGPSGPARPGGAAAVAGEGGAEPVALAAAVAVPPEAPAVREVGLRGSILLLAFGV